jgi:hypothetical protein
VPKGEKAIGRDSWRCVVFAVLKRNHTAISV